MRIVRYVPVALAGLLLSCSSAPKTVPPHVFQMGERVPVGKMIYTVFERQWHTQFGTGPSARVPQYRFYLLRITAVNSGAAETIIPQLALVDDTGTSYPESDDGDGVTDWLGGIRQVAPSETSQGYVLFDCPPKHYKLQFTDDDGTPTALVDIPLSFDSDTPDVTTPLDPDKLIQKK